MGLRSYSKGGFFITSFVLTMMCILLAAPSAVSAVCDPVTIMPLGDSITDDYGGYWQLSRRFV